MRLVHRAGNGETEVRVLRLDPFASARRPNLLSLTPREGWCRVWGGAAEVGFLEPGPWSEKEDSMSHQKPIHAELRDGRTLQQFWQDIQLPGEGWLVL